MPSPTPLPLRQAIFRRCQAGEAAAAIARDLGLPGRTVQRLARRCRTRGTAALAPAYRRPPPQQTTWPPYIVLLIPVGRRRI